MGKVKPENEWKFKCAETGKAIKRKKRYYRNGKYYITKSAWKAKAKKDADKAAEVAAAAAAKAAEAAAAVPAAEAQA